MVGIALGVLGLMAMLNGCAFLTKEPDMIAVPLQQARNVYASLRTYYGDWKAAQDVKCATQMLPPGECAKLLLAHEEFRKLDWEIRRGLENPKAETDWAKLSRIIELMAGFTP